MTDGVSDQAFVDAAGDGVSSVIYARLASPEPIPEMVARRSLLAAVRNGRADVVRLLVSDPRFALNYRPDHARPLSHALIHATRHGQVEVIDALLAHSDVHARNWMFANAVEDAVVYDRIDILQRLLTMPPAYRPTYESMIAAINCGNARAIELLLADGRCALESGVLLWAAESKNRDVVRAILLDARATTPAAIRMALDGLQHFSPEIARMLVRHPAVDPSIDNNIVLHNAALQGRTDIVYLLLSDTRVRDTNYVAIQHAAASTFREHEPILRLLLASWGELADRRAAAEAAHAAATPANRAYITQLMSENGIRTLDYLNGFLPFNLDPDVFEELARQAHEQRLDPAVLRTLHRANRVAPIIAQTFGWPLATSFSDVLEDNLARLSECSRSSGGVRLGGTMPHVLRKMINGMSEIAADLLWQHVKRVDGAVAVSNTALIRTWLCAECVARLKDARHVFLP